MVEKGLAAASSAETTTAPKTMYKEVEQNENVARGYVEVTEIIAYDYVGKEEVIDDLTGEPTGQMRIVEKGRSPYFCQDKEDVRIFMDNNPGTRTEDANKVVIAASGVRTETFVIQLFKSTAIKYLNAPRNMKQFERPEEVSEAVASPVQTLQKPEPNWREQAKALGIPMFQRSKEEVLADIVEQTTTSTS